MQNESLTVLFSGTTVGLRRLELIPISTIENEIKRLFVRVEADVGDMPYVKILSHEHDGTPSGFAWDTAPTKLDDLSTESFTAEVNRLRNLVRTHLPDYKEDHAVVTIMMNHYGPSALAIAIEKALADVSSKSAVTRSSKRQAVGLASALSESWSLRKLSPRSVALEMSPKGGIASPDDFPIKLLSHYIRYIHLDNPHYDESLEVTAVLLEYYGSKLLSYKGKATTTVGGQVFFDLETIATKPIDALAAELGVVTNIQDVYNQQNFRALLLFVGYQRERGRSLKYVDHVSNVFINNKLTPYGQYLWSRANGASLDAKLMHFMEMVAPNTLVARIRKYFRTLWFKLRLLYKGVGANKVNDDNAEDKAVIAADFQPKANAQRAAEFEALVKKAERYDREIIVAESRVDASRKKLNDIGTAFSTGKLEKNGPATQGRLQVRYTESNLQKAFHSHTQVLSTRVVSSFNRAKTRINLAESCYRDARLKATEAQLKLTEVDNLAKSGPSDASVLKTAEEKAVKAQANAEESLRFFNRIVTEANEALAYYKAVSQEAKEFFVKNKDFFKAQETTYFQMVNKAASNLDVVKVDDKVPKLNAGKAKGTLETAGIATKDSFHIAPGDLPHIAREDFPRIAKEDLFIIIQRAQAKRNAHVSQIKADKAQNNIGMAESDVNRAKASYTEHYGAYSDFNNVIAEESKLHKDAVILNRNADILNASASKRMLRH
ncbi:hypothetical protein CCR75_008350 [Bremia lactucae]|uniref:Uncharacterized protein n=1 Tax=Bremia lactucae TaxID=4779 RepID=A0A976FI95_BRELC|nr:hypothetical protein CCR75_008350 [Bremia lactucae]